MGSFHSLGSSSPLLRAVIVGADCIESVFPWSLEFLWFEDDILVERVSSTDLVESSRVHDLGRTYSCGKERGVFFEALKSA